MTTSDRIVWYEAYGLRLSLTPDREHLQVRGDPQVYALAAGAIRHRRAELVEYLRSLSDTQ
jgi:hypothetical protein